MCLIMYHRLAKKLYLKNKQAFSLNNKGQHNLGGNSEGIILLKEYVFTCCVNLMVSQILENIICSSFCREAQRTVSQSESLHVRLVII